MDEVKHTQKHKKHRSNGYILCHFCVTNQMRIRLGMRKLPSYSLLHHTVTLESIDQTTDL